MGLKSGLKGRYSNLREFVVNYRHPDHRRAWKGGSEPQFWDHFGMDPQDPADLRTNSKKLDLIAIIDT